MKLKYADKEHKINVVASHTYDIEVNEQIVGKFCLLFTNKIVSLWGVEVYSEYRGKGYAKQALLSVIQALREQGRHILALYVKSDNINAISLYESLGFKLISQEDSNSLYYELDLCEIRIGNLPHYNKFKEINL